MFFFFFLPTSPHFKIAAAFPFVHAGVFERAGLDEAYLDVTKEAGRLKEGLTSLLTQAHASPFTSSSWLHPTSFGD